MTAQNKTDKRGTIGYGSSYRKGDRKDMGKPGGIGSVFGGQVWVVKPDKEAQDQTPCLWMQAGVVQYKACNNFYDCVTCKYDLGMRRQVEQNKQISWQDAMRRRPDLERVCRHSLTGRISSRACAYDFQCASCDFDQLFEDFLTPKAGGAPTEIYSVKGFDLPVNHYFHSGHGWARIESGGLIRVGLDDFALKLLGEADALELPLMGKELDQGAVGWGLKRKGNLADVLSPVDGVIVEVNDQVRQNPGVANREPYGGGWLFALRHPDIKSTVKKLMHGTESLNWMGQEVGALEGMIEAVAGPMAADGGYLKPDIYGNLPGLRWGDLTKRFLKTG